MGTWLTAPPQCRIDYEEQGEEGPHLDDEHDGVFPLDVGPEHDEGLLERRPRDVRLQEFPPFLAAFPGREPDPRYGSCAIGLSIHG